MLLNSEGVVGSLCCKKFLRMDERTKSINCHCLNIYGLSGDFFWHQINLWMNAGSFISTLLLRLYRAMATQNYFNKFLHPGMDLRGSLGSHMDIIWWLAFVDHLRPSRRAGRSDYLCYGMEKFIHLSRNYSWRKVFFDTIPNIRECLRPTRRPSNKTLFLLI